MDHVRSYRFFFVGCLSVSSTVLSLSLSLSSGIHDVGRRERSRYRRNGFFGEPTAAVPEDRGIRDAQAGARRIRRTAGEGRDPRRRIRGRLCCDRVDRTGPRTGSRARSTAEIAVLIHILRTTGRRTNAAGRAPTPDARRGETIAATARRMNAVAHDRCRRRRDANRRRRRAHGPLCLRRSVRRRRTGARLQHMVRAAHHRPEDRRIARMRRAVRFPRLSPSPSCTPETSRSPRGRRPSTPEVDARHRPDRPRGAASRRGVCHRRGIPPLTDGNAPFYRSMGGRRNESHTALMRLKRPLTIGDRCDGRYRAQ